MTNDISLRSVGIRAGGLADRLEQGARAMAVFASTLTEAQWRMPVPRDGRTVGVIVHYAACVYPFGIEMAQKVAAGRTITGVTMEDVDAMTAKHARENGGISKDAALELLARNSGAAAAATRALSDDALAKAATVSLYGHAPLTCQFLLEDQAIRHSYHHLRLIARALAA